MGSRNVEIIVFRRKIFFVELDEIMGQKALFIELIKE